MSELRWHLLLEEWVPESDYHIAVFENRFPSYTGEQGRCEVVCYTPVHDSSLGEQSVEHIQDLIEVWRDRTNELGRLPNVRYVYVFENRGEAIGVTLSHPHGQIYGYPFVPPVVQRELAAEARYARKNGRCLYCDVIEGETSGQRTVARNDRWIAFVPPFARWPYEVHLAPLQHRGGLADLDDEDNLAFARLLKDLLQRYDRLFNFPLPYVMAMHQRPPGRGHRQHHFHVEFYPPNRSRNKMKFLAGSELGAGAFILDARAEDTAAELRAL
ncbi:MAG: galactose-1-phosphate uridylyltransferase [Chloroflexi bacterium]|nr:MAG: galactose-1-phosphate uridylyltransferase [Chloroflexota bacterium]